MQKEERKQPMPIPHTMRAKQAAAFLGVHEKTVWLWARTGRLPRPIRQGARCSVWLTSDLEEYLARCASGGNG